MDLARTGIPWLTLVGVTIAVVEAATVIVLRAHYTMDVFAGAVTALYAAGLAVEFAPPLDRTLAALVG